MHEEIDLLVQAIEKLESSTSDYVFPLIASISSTLLGAFVAYLTIKHQENIQINKDQIRAINEILLVAADALFALFHIKATYYPQDFKLNPIHKALDIKSTVFATTKIAVDLTKLSFIVPITKIAIATASKWQNLIKLRELIDSYNRNIDMWNKRNELYLLIRSRIDNAKGILSSDELMSLAGGSDLLDLVLMTERALLNTDELIVDLNSFLEEFPLIGMSLFDKKYIEKYGPY
ncbi:hypothetical protein [Nitrosomonas ureae]|uniref:Uncharacterized protein n=1 Tax=Nitrosomonas ureae TaxID=44577 RepID=A0A1H5WET3_9PROT|nr:hypothetical protein [Nitrosomonas ureae]SEF97984.1 hypothetical protein SAMN05216334_11819 [Nitrosomonas ureae]